MLTAIYLIVSLIVFFKLIGFLLRVTWGAAKLIVGLIFWPVIILAAVFGIIWLALPILILIGILTSLIRV